MKRVLWGELKYCKKILKYFKINQSINLQPASSVYGLIYPFLSYGIVAWGHSAKANTTRIFVLQKKKGSKIHCRAKTSRIVQK
jgi:hypothetical protein